MRRFTEHLMAPEYDHVPFPHGPGCARPQHVDWRFSGMTEDGRERVERTCQWCGATQVLLDGTPDDGGPERAKALGGGPPPGLGLDVATIRAALREWQAGWWPPPQEQLTDYTARRIHQVLTEEGTDWRTEVAAAEADRKRR